MKIDSSSKASGAPLLRETRGQANTKATAASVDDVHLSGTAAQLISADDDQAFDSARVSEIRQAIAEGRFTINASAIADRLINSAKELVAAQRQA